MFPHGEQGWHTKIPVAGDPDQTTRSPWVSQRCYYAYRLHPRILEPDTIFRCGRLFQQYVVDTWASIETSNLFWICTHQKDIHADTYQGICDVVNNADVNPNLAQQGTHIILPSTHSGSTCHMYQLF